MVEVHTHKHTHRHTGLAPYYTAQKHTYTATTAVGAPDAELTAWMKIVVKSAQARSHALRISVGGKHLLPCLYTDTTHPQTFYICSFEKLNRLIESSYKSF